MDIPNFDLPVVLDVCPYIDTYRQIPGVCTYIYSIQDRSAEEYHQSPIRNAKDLLDVFIDEKKEKPLFSTAFTDNNGGRAAGVEIQAVCLHSRIARLRGIRLYFRLRSHGDI